MPGTRDRVVSPRLTIIACGALAHELVALRDANQWAQVRIKCLPAALHNRPQAIPGAVDAALEALDLGAVGGSAFVAYADCGTGGRLDAVLERHGVQRLPGAHCYEFFAGAGVFAALSDAEPGTFYLTDFLARHFERLIIRELGIETHPELESLYFGNYKRLVYLAQAPTPALKERARAAAQRLGLEYEYRFTGYGEMRVTVEHVVRHAS